MRTYKMRKFPPKEEREDDLRHTLISSITQKLQRMDVDQLREIYHAATKTVQQQKWPDESF